ncbi:hypothetical protein PT015_17315 [Candidatus Mycobacterium wuenschmannii]|uniref:Uncharacterized protein n=1 Tax=Candidatus Mycobacterium wuenschmannii TaxID=3027808 RepID=A0ABY8VV23_9MYCO|nr:hypothetical protein [Candidatus Mycobacterium wuenschmannii]WIM86639.1 hypothetical protein PT015_17315 [Candidatus Mycobacterium wuenschmannii]
MTRLLFDYLADSLPEGVDKSDVVELRDNNVLILDLREPSQGLIVKTIVEGLPSYLGNLQPDLQSSVQPGFTELQRLASAQHRHNQTAAK